jgi:hypothetical protein
MIIPRFIIFNIAMTLLFESSMATGYPVSRRANTSGQHDQVQADPRTLWEQAIAAKGGRDKLYSVENMLISKTGAYPNALGKSNSFRTVTLNLFQHGFWGWYDYGADVFGRTVETYNFDAGIRYYSNSDDPPPKPRAILPYETAQSRTYGLLSYLMETKWLKPILIRSAVGREGGDLVDIVYTKLLDRAEGFETEEVPIDFALDRRTHLPVRVTFYSKLGKPSVVEHLSDYTEVNGIKVPSVNKIDGRVDTIKIQFNIPYDKDILNKPPLLSAGSEAWRPHDGR